MPVHAVHGTVTVDTSGTRVLDLPGVAEFPVETGSSPIPWLSRFTPSDPADAELFKITSIGTLTTPGSNALAWLGVRCVAISYTLTGGSPIDVDFQLVWDDDVDLANDLEFNGDL